MLPRSPRRAGEALHQEIQESHDARRSLSAPLENRPEREAVGLLKAFHQRHESSDPDSLGHNDISEADDTGSISSRSRASHAAR